MAVCGSIRHIDQRRIFLRYSPFVFWVKTLRLMPADDLPLSME
jgi:hypothetical protein